MSESWEPDLTALAVRTPWTRDEWARAWDALEPHYRTEYHWPALVGMAAVFGYAPTTCAGIINGVPV